ncbi:MAG: hypothetical protein JWO08_3070 [Verrucomicrobiaceae bacterium]|nr:hypothetical protein [Verrucomicrobiaceae bacterium]
MRFFFLIFLFVATAFANAAGDDSLKVRPDPQILYILRVFTLPKVEGLELLAKDLDDSALHQHLIDQAKATPEVLEKLILVVGDNTEMMELQQGNELLYPTEFDPQQLPQRLAIGDAALIPFLHDFFDPPPAPAPTPPLPAPPDAGPSEKSAAPSASPPSHRAPTTAKRTAANRAATPSETAAATSRHTVNGGLGIVGSITPTAFQTALLGDLLKLTPNRSNVTGQTGVTVDFHTTRLEGFQTYNGESLAQISSRHVSTETVLTTGAPVFLGTFSSPQQTGGEFQTPDSTVSLVFITPRSLSWAAYNKGPSMAEADVFTAFFEVISLPKQEASALVDEGLEQNALHLCLKSAMHSGTAKLEAFLSGRVVSGAATVLQETDKYQYPTEFDPPQIVQRLLIADDELLADLRAGRQTGSGVAPPTGGPHNGGFGLMTTVTPTAFQSRELGTKLEIEVSHEDQLLSLKLKPQLTRLIGEKRYMGVVQPLFESDSLATTIKVRPGLTQFVGTLNRPLNTGLKEENQENRVWFAFVTVRAAR